MIFKASKNAFPKYWVDKEKFCNGLPLGLLLRARDPALEKITPRRYCHCKQKSLALNMQVQFIENPFHKCDKK